MQRDAAPEPTLGKTNRLQNIINGGIKQHYFLKNKKAPNIDASSTFKTE